MGVMPRVMVFSPSDQPAAELAPRDVIGLVMYEEINGEHSLEITTTTVLEKEMRILTCDHMGKWREWVVTGVDQEHSSGRTHVGTYYCVWSLQHDLSLTKVDAMPGVSTPVAASTALAAALGGTRRWSVGNVTRTTLGGASMWYKSGWEAIGIVVETWGGEVDATIEVGTSGVVSRSVDLYDAMGNQTATRRFDWGRDLASIRRTVSDAPMAARIIPRGKGEETESGGYGRKITIESVNDGVEWLQNDETAQAYRLPDGQGGYEYPTLIVENGSIEDAGELKEWGLAVIDQYTTPQVTYEGDVLQFEQAGMDVHGVALGDVTQCVDTGFSPEGLRVSGRVVARRVNLLKETDMALTIGSMRASLARRFSNATKAAEAISNMNGGSLSTEDYLNALLKRLNGEMNANGGYWYMIPGLGTRTYDSAVSDEAVGDEASQVVEVRGGNIRIANSRTATGEWDWRTMLESGRIASDMVVAARIVSGYIRSPNGNLEIDADAGTLRFQSPTLVDVGDMTLADALNDAKRYATDFLSYEGGELTLGSLESVIKLVLTHQLLKFASSEGDVAWFGKTAENIWNLFIETASIQNMLRFGDFAWIARNNGNMTLKWVGD